MIEKNHESETALRQRSVDMFKASTPPMDAPIADWRDGFERMCASFEIPEDACFENVEAGGVPCVKVTMPGASSDRVIIHFHSGGYMMGSASGYRNFGCRLSRATGATVLLPDYRLAPEHVYPAAQQDGFTVYKWCAARWSPARIIVSGDSAGGGLCLATLMSVRDSGEPLPAGGIMISPLFDLAAQGESVKANHDVDPLIDETMIVEIGKIYIEDRDPHKTPLASPLYGAHHGLPPLYMTVSNSEVLRDDVTRVAASVTKAGGNVIAAFPRDLVHIWTIFPFLDATAKTMNEIAQFTRGCFD